MISDTPIVISQCTSFPLFTISHHHISYSGNSHHSPLYATIITQPSSHSHHHTTHFLMTQFQKLRLSFSLSSSSQAMRVSCSLILKRSPSQYFSMLSRAECAQNMFCTLSWLRLLRAGSSICMLPSTSIEAGKGLSGRLECRPCFMNSPNILLRTSLTSLMVAMLSRSYRNSDWTLFLKMEWWLATVSFMRMHTSLTPSKTRSSFLVSLSKLNFWMTFSRLSNTPATSVRDLATLSQLQNRVSRALLSFSQCASISPMRRCELVMYLSMGSSDSYWGKQRSPPGTHISENTFGLMMFSYFLKSVGLLSIMPTKIRTILDLRSTSFRMHTYLRNSTTMYLYLLRVSGSLASELFTSHPSGSKQGSRMWGYSLCRITLSFLKSLNFLWMMWLQGLNFIWQSVQSPCRKFLVFCSVSITTMSLIAGSGGSSFAFIPFILISPVSMMFLVLATAFCTSSAFNSENYFFYGLSASLSISFSLFCAPPTAFWVGLTPLAGLTDTILSGFSSFFVPGASNTIQSKSLKTSSCLGAGIGF